MIYISRASCFSSSYGVRARINLIAFKNVIFSSLVSPASNFCTHLIFTPICSASCFCVSPLSFLISLIFIVCHLQNAPLLAYLYNTPLSAYCQAPFAFFRKEKERFPVLIHQQAAARKFARLAPSRSRAARSLARRARRFQSGLLLSGSGSARRAGAGPRVLPEIVRQPLGAPLFSGRRRWLCRLCICIASWRCASFFIPKIGR